MKKSLIICCILFFGTSVCSQNFASIEAKEKYDLFESQETDEAVCTRIPSFYTSPTTGGVSDDEDGRKFGDGISKTIESYLDMYETTLDKAYLYRFIFQSMCILENRHDINSQIPNNPEPADNEIPMWSTYPYDGNQYNFQSHAIYQDGYILAAFARFSFLVKNLYPTLFDEPLYLFDEINSNLYAPLECECNYTGHDFNTFGAFCQFSTR